MQTPFNHENASFPLLNIHFLDVQDYDEADKPKSEYTQVILDDNDDDAGRADSSDEISGKADSSDDDQNESSSENSKSESDADDAPSVEPAVHDSDKHSESYSVPQMKVYDDADTSDGNNSTSNDRMCSQFFRRRFMEFSSESELTLFTYKFLDEWTAGFADWGWRQNSVEKFQKMTELVDDFSIAACM